MTEKPLCDKKIGEIGTYKMGFDERIGKAIFRDDLKKWVIAVVKTCENRRDWNKQLCGTSRGYGIWRCLACIRFIERFEIKRSDLDGKK